MNFFRAMAFALLLFSPVLAAAEDRCDEFVVDETARPADNTAFAALLARTADSAQDADCLVQADRLLEGAHRLDPQPRYIHRRVLVLEAREEFEYAHELLDAYREQLLADPAIDGVAELDARLRARLRGAPEPIEPPGPVPSRRSRLDTIGPIVLASAGVVALGFAVYGLTAKCRDTASDGTCLSGSQTAPAPTLAYSATGVLALTSAAVWWVLAIPPRTDGSASIGFALRW